MEHPDKEFIKEFIEETMSKETQQALVNMCCESIKAFKSCLSKNPFCQHLKELKTLIDIIAIESSITHHNLLWRQQSDGGMVRIAHQCAEVLIMELIKDFDAELTLEENIELWKLKRI